MPTRICPIIKILNERLEDLRSITMSGRPLTSEEENAYYSLLEAKFHTIKARAHLQEMEVRHAREKEQVA